MVLFKSPLCIMKAELTLINETCSINKRTIKLVKFVLSRGSVYWFQPRIFFQESNVASNL